METGSALGAAMKKIQNNPMHSSLPAASGEPSAMKIATFNVNNINKRLPNLTAWLRSAKPDVVCLQELKSTDADFPIGALRGAEPVLTRRDLPGDPQDSQSRYIEAAVNGILIGCLYAPNGNPQPGPKFDYKLAWLDRLIEHAAALKVERVPV